MKKILFIVPVCGLFFYFAGWRIAHASSDHLWINQIQVEGDGGNSDEFIELFNPTDSAISLSGWSLQYKSSSGNFPLTAGKKNLPNASIAPQGYFLITTSSYNGGVVADHVQSTISLSGTSTGATLFLVNSTAFLTNGVDSSVVDKLAYGSSANNSPETANASTPPSEKSLIRSADTDNNFVDFTIADSNPHNSASVSVPVSPTPTPAPVPTPTPTPSSDSQTPPGPIYSSDIKISEIFMNPDGKDDGEEWLEFFNNSYQDVDLSGWVVDDEGQTGIVGKDAYVFPDQTLIKAKSYLALNLPAEAFALNNTGGDTVRLFWPNDTMITQAVYPGAAKEDSSWALKSDGGYGWTTLVTKSALNQFEQASLEPGIISEAETKIKFNEIFPNPKSSDSGSEWIEIKNFGAEPISLHDWILDDGEITADIGSSAYKIQSPIVYPQGLAVIMIPSGKFAINNSGKETVRLFNPNKVLIDFITFESSGEDQSYALVDGKWIWSKPSPNAVNVLATEIQKVEAVKVAASKTIAAPAKAAPVLSIEDPVAIAVPTAEAGTGQIAGTSIANPETPPPKPLWPWLAGSFAVNLVFCYSLIKIMTSPRRKGGIPPSIDN